jgi:endonuclease/exonuclease/phosphatase family metal-dependent hydrolase
MSSSFRVVTYNIHQCRGLDQKLQPGRILDVLQEIDADVVALQEVLCLNDGARELNQGLYLAQELGFHHVFGGNLILEKGGYGNLILSRFRILEARNHDISVSGRQPRGCLRADVEVAGNRLHVFNAHLGTSLRERRLQAPKLLAEEVLNKPGLSSYRIVLGDFNDWTRFGLITRMLSREMEAAPLAKHLKWKCTYPGVLPLLHLDHIYHDSALQLERLRLHRSRKALVASDHLPLVADFQWATRPVEDLATAGLA